MSYFYELKVCKARYYAHVKKIIPTFEILIMDEKKDFKLWIYGLIGTIIIIGLWIFTYYHLKDLPHTDRGTLGDMFGTVNALFSGLALAGIIFTILLQRKELGYQREELKATRLEFSIQNETLRLQRFENTFFNLLTLHHKIVDSIDFDTQIAKKDGRALIPMGSKVDYEIVTVKSRDVFKQKYEALVKLFDNQTNDMINDTYLRFYGTVQTDFGHYFRNLYRIIKFVKETEFKSMEDLELEFKNKSTESDNDKYKIVNHEIRYKYTSMIRAQLSDYELLWIFYNCLSKNGIEKFKPLIEEFTLLKNLPKEKIHSPEFLKGYSAGAFKRNNE